MSKNNRNQKSRIQRVGKQIKIPKRRKPRRIPVAISNVTVKYGPARAFGK